MLLALKNHKEISDWKRVIDVIKCHHENAVNYNSAKFELALFKDTISRIVKLHESEKITDEQFRGIITFLCTAYLTNEIESRINNKLDKTLCEFLERI